MPLSPQVIEKIEQKAVDFQNQMGQQRNRNHENSIMLEELAIQMRRKRGDTVGQSVVINQVPAEGTFGGSCLGESQITSPGLRSP